MMLLRCFNQFLLLSSATALSLGTQRQGQVVQWSNCIYNSTVPIDCGNLTVPLDYTAPDSREVLQLELLRVPASKEPKMGSILFNFGGPGVGCNFRLAQLSETLQIITGGHYDLIGWDPRGTENTLTFACYDSLEENIAAGLQNQAGGLGNISDKTVVGRNWAVQAIFAETCFNKNTTKDRGSLIGNAFTARDAMQIVEALEEDGLLRYWGFSYGTTLGATIAAMFPERVDKVILDAVMNPYQYYDDFDIEIWSDTDMVFGEFFKKCLEAPAACELARTHGNIMAKELENQAYEIFDKLKYRPMWYDGMLIDSTMVKSAIRPALYGPGQYSALGSFMDAIFAYDPPRIVEEYNNLMDQAPAVLAGGGPDNAPHGIHCADKRFRFDSVDDVLPYLEKLELTTRLSGDLASPFPMVCSQWKFESKERYGGGFAKKTRKPLLIIGGAYDPATPFRSAQNVTEGFEGSVLLRHEGFGHGSNNHPSLCTARAVQAYFMNGTLPAPGTACTPEVGPFANTSWAPYLPLLL